MLNCSTSRLHLYTRQWPSARAPESTNITNQGLHRSDARGSRVREPLVSVEERKKRGSRALRMAIKVGEVYTLEEDSCFD